VSGTEALIGIVYEFLYDGIFTWFYSVFDIAGNEFVSENNTITIDTSNPSVVLVWPENDSLVSSDTHYFAGNFSDVNGLVNSTLMIWNSTGDLINSTLSVLSGVENVSNVSVTLPYQDSFEWNYYVCDEAENCGFNESNYTLEYLGNQIGLSWIYPSGNINVVQNTSFVVSFNVSCLSGTCGEINVSLDPPENWWDGKWRRRKNVSISNAGTSTLDDFPMYLNVSYESGMQSDYDDLRFVNGSCESGETLELDYEIENFTDSSAHVWVRIPSLGSSGQMICMYFGNAGAENGENATGVWDSNYLSVYHLADLSGNQTDSVGNNDLVNDGATYGAAGITGPALDVTGVGDNIEGANTYTYNFGGEMSMEAWFQYNGAGAGSPRILELSLAGNIDAHALAPDDTLAPTDIRAWAECDSSARVGSADDNTNYNDGEWHHVYYTYSTGDGDLYVDGQLTDGNNVGGCGNLMDTPYIIIGAISDIGGTYEHDQHELDGYIDEVRVSDAKRTPDWINQTYQMVRDQGGIVSFGLEEITKGNLVSTVIGDVPFYTNNSNPQNISLSMGESEVVEFWVNATGEINSSWEFFGFANLTFDLGIGNITNSWNVTITGPDLISPLLSIESPVNGTTYFVSSLDFNVSSNEALSSCVVSLDGFGLNYSMGAFNSTYFNYTNTSLGDGIFTASYWCNDTSGNVNGTESVEFTVDAQGPNATLFAPANDSYLNNVTQNLSASLSDVIGLENATLFIYNSTGDLINQTSVYVSGTEALIGIVYEFLYDGIFTWFYQVYDVAGNLFTSSNNTLTIDTLNPEIDYGVGTADNEANFSLSNIYVNVSVVELNEANLTFRLWNSSETVNVTTLGAGNRSFNFTGLGDGIYYYNVSISDLAGNVNETDTRVIRLDNSNPVLFMTYPVNDSIYTSSVEELNYTIFDLTIDSCWYSLDEGQTNVSVNCGQNVTGLDSGDGQHNWTIWGNDSFGRVGSYTSGFFVDNSLPDVNIVYPVAGIYGFNITELNYTASDDDLDSCWYSLDEGLSNVSISCDENATGLISGHGQHNWTVWVNDTTGGTSSDVVSFIVDQVSPNGTLLTPGNETLTSNTSLNLTANVSDDFGLLNATLFIYNELGALVNSTTVSVSGTEALVGIVYNFLSDGIFTWYYQIFDIGGNEFTTGNNTVIIDTTGPVVDLVSPENNSIVSNETVYFASNFTEVNYLYNSTLMIWNSSGDLINETFRSVSGAVNSSNISVALPGYDVYEWNYFVCDTLGNCAFNSSNNSLIYEIEQVGLELIYPTGNINVLQNRFFNVTVNVSCLGGVCGEINVSLDPENWWDGDWERRKDINISNVGASDLTDFPIYLNVSYESVMQSDFDDLRFINGSCESGETLELDYEIENYTGSSAHVWLRIPLLGIGGQSVCMYYGNDGASNGENVSGVWDDNYRGVYHLSESGTQSRNDSTLYGNNASTSGYEGDENIAGIVGFADDFDGTDDYLESSTTNGIPSGTAGQEVTTSFWVYRDTSPSGGQGIIGIDTEWMSLLENDAGGGGGNDIFIRTWGSNNAGTSQSITLNDWYHIVTIWDVGTDFTVYVNGEFWASDTTATADTSADTGNPLYIGQITNGGPLYQTRYNGILDEVRISNVARTLDWANQSYQMVVNQNDVVSFGPEEVAKNGLISTIIGDVPFYTNESNPRNISLGNGESQEIVFWVNGTSLGTYEFFAFANLTSDLSVSNITSRWNVTVGLPDTSAPGISIVSPVNQSYSVTSVDFNVTGNENLSSCLFSLNDLAVNYSMSEWNSTYFNYTNTSMTDGNYTARFSCVDLEGNSNSTEFVVFQVDTLGPNATLFLPENETYTNITSQNFSVNASDLVGLENATLLIYNSTGDLINETSVTVSGTEALIGIVFDFLVDGVYTWFYRVYDIAGNLFITGNRTIIIDTTYPLIDYGVGALDDFTNVSYTSIYVNVSVVEINEANITFILSNESGIVNTSFFDTEVREINWTGLDDGLYSYFVSVLDLANQVNSTETRELRVDTSSPDLTLVYPTDVLPYSDNVTNLNYTVSDPTLQACWYSVDDGVTNVTITCGENVTTLNAGDGVYNWTIYANDSFGHESSDKVTFVVNTDIPTVTIVYPLAIAYPYNITELNYTVFDSELDSCWYSLDDGVTNNSVNCDENVTGLNAGHGFHNWTVYANDSGGTVGFFKTEFEVDTVFPELTIISPMNQTYHAQYPVEFNVSGSENLDYCAFSFDGFINNYSMTAFNGTYFNYTNSSMPPGSYVASFWCNDSVGNVNNTENVSFSVAYPELGLDLLVPSGNVNVTYGEFFEVSMNVSCGIVDCGIVNVSLDPTVNWWNLTFGKRKAINLSSAVDSELVNFPIYLNVSKESEMQDDFDDIRFVNGSCEGGDNSLLDYEIENFTDSSAHVWVRMPILSSSGQTICMYYGSSTVSGEQNSIGVWANNFSSVYHLADLSGDQTDSVNNSDGVNDGATYGASGVVGPALDVTGIGDNIETDQSYTYSFSTEVTLEAWFQFTDIGAGSPRILEISATGNADSHALAPDGDGGLRAWAECAGSGSNRRGDADAPLSTYDDGNWHHMVYTYTSNDARMFVDGEQVDTGLVEACGDLDDGGYLIIGAISEGSGQYDNDQHEFDGYIDEARVSTVVRSPDWINQTYQIMNNPSGYVTFGDGEGYEKGLVSDVIGDIPFYTNESNPRELDLNASQSSIVTFWVNATGPVYSTYEFFAFANLTENTTINNITEFWNVTIIPQIEPVSVELLYPENGANFSSLAVDQFNFTADSDNSLDTCQLWGNWTGVWHLNQTLTGVNNGNETNFSGITLLDNGYYTWNVWCNDSIGTFAWGENNFTFAAFAPPAYPLLLNASQSENDGTGNVTLFWNSSARAITYRIYYNASMAGNFSLLAETSSLNYTDDSFNGSVRRFYYVSAVNPGGENASEDYFGAHVYTLRHNGNTRNWVGFPTNATYLENANDTLNEVRNATAVTEWNATTQTRRTCNDFSCPSFPSCTATNCNFGLRPGSGYEVNVNSSAPSELNWSLAGIVYRPVDFPLIKNATDFGKNWISLWANTTLINANGLITNISNADAVSHWDSSGQTSEGYLEFPPFGYIGTNFVLNMETGYEVSVTADENWTQV
jgi:hypothetical protein